MCSFPYISNFHHIYSIEKPPGIDPAAFLSMIMREC